MELQPSWQELMVPNYPVPGLCLMEGNGHVVMDQEGKSYVDLLAGIATNVLGHAHPAIVQAVAAQVERLGHVSNLYSHPQVLQLAQRLSEKTGGHQALFVNSGTEANEAALKLMRRKAHAEGRDAVIIALHNSFHGRTSGALALTGQPRYQEGCGPMPADIIHVTPNDTAALNDAFASHDVVGVFVECIQGEGGVHPLTDEFVKQLIQLTQTPDTLLCVDEVQTGMGRTGTFHAHTRLGLQPELVTMAKGLGGGLPIGVLMAEPTAARHLSPGSHGCTFGGNPIAAAASNAVLDTMDADDLPERARQLGQAAKELLAHADVPVRGEGLLLGIDCGDAASTVAAMQEKGYLVGQAGPNVVRLSPPLNIPMDAWLDGIQTLAETVR